MTAVSEALASLELGDEQTFERLTAVPLMSAHPVANDYLTLDEALAAGAARVTEVSDAGSVPELLFRNSGDLAVFLLDGEELTTIDHTEYLRETGSEGIEVIMWLVMRGALDLRVREVDRFYHVPASNTAYGLVALENAAP